MAGRWCLVCTGLKTPSDHTTYLVGLVSVGDGIEARAYVAHGKKDVESVEVVQNAADEFNGQGME